MVKGIEVFREHFKGHEDQYLLIGGTACDLLYGDQGLSFRATKDFDVVLCVEALDPAAGFMARFWEFIALGGYQAQQKGDERRLYRFIGPTDERYPHMVELFSRAPMNVQVDADAHLVPIPGGEEASSLSAILLSDASYNFLVTGTTLVDGVRLATAERLIALKAHAWCEIHDRKAEGWARQAAKHRKDIYRLGRLLVPSARMPYPLEMSAYLRTWLEAEVKGEMIDRKELGGLSQAKILETIRAVCL